MDSQTIREALATLQGDPDSGHAWTVLRESALSDQRELEQDELLKLLASARRRHAERGEWDAGARLLELETTLSRDAPQELELMLERGRVLAEELFDDQAAQVAYERVLELQPEHSQAKGAIDEARDKRERRDELIENYLLEAEQAPDDIYKSSMLMRAAEMELRFGGESLDQKRVTDRLEQAVHLDPTNERAGRMLERIYRRDESWPEVANTLERIADQAEEPAARVAAGIRLARVYRYKREDMERAARVYQRVLAQSPENVEGMEFLSELYSSQERWDDLVRLYEQELEHKGDASADRLGDIFQIAMLHWRKRERPEDAEPWFERVRKLEPGHEGMIQFYRDYCAITGDEAHLLEVLQGAQRATEDVEKQTALAQDIARLAEGQANAQKAIEQYKSLLRQNPDDVEAREALKRLYKQTQGFNALVELLRQELERTPPDDYEQRLKILREVANVYRQHIKSDTALVSILNQIVQLDEKLDSSDVAEVRELVQLYEKLGRWRDLLSTQEILAGITDDPEEKQALYRSVARRWLEQFSNVQHATEAYAALIKIAPEDPEAREKLEDLYRRRRAWPSLYELFESELETATGERRLTLKTEMAQLAAERLGRPDDAVRLYKEILDEDKTRVEALDQLERFAERSKDFATLANALERRVELLDDDQARLNVLQKLGTVYADQLEDPQQAASAWRRIIEIQPGQTRALRVLRETYLQACDYDALEELYSSQNDWEGLADVLSNAADRAKEPEAKVALSYRAAAVYEEHLGQPDRAFRSYERILATDPNDVRAARALVPLYEQDEKWVRLPPLYELMLERSEDENEKLDLLEKLIEVTGKRLSDRKAAVEYARRAYQVAPGNERALKLFEEASRMLGSWDAFVDALEARLKPESPQAPEEAQPARKKRGRKRKKSPEQGPAVEPSLSESERRALEIKLAGVYTDLGKKEEAIETYKRMLERDPADSEAASALEAILRSDDRRDDLRWLLSLKVEHAANDEQRVRTLADWAALEEDVFDSPERAIQRYQQLVELEPTNSTALTSLPRLLLEQNDATGAARIVEQHRDQLIDEERAQKEVELADLYASRLDRPLDALEAAIRALASEGYRGSAKEILERLVENEATGTRAAEVLATEYASSGEARQEARALDVLFRQARDESERLGLAHRLIGVHEEKLNAYGDALEVALRAVRLFPREIDLWQKAERLAVHSGRAAELGETFKEVLSAELPADIELELCERAATFHEERLGDPIGATPYLERMLALDVGNESAFRRLKDILTAAERWDELEGLYDSATKAESDPGRRLDMLAEVALICEEIIEDPEKAVRYYERTLEADPQHDTSIKALDRLYGKLGRREELASLLDRRVDLALGEELFDLKLRLARLRIELGEPEKVIQHVEDVLAERPGDYEARELAEKMLEVPALKVRAARMLEVIYEERHEIRELDRVLAIRWEGLEEQMVELPEDERAAHADERRELLRRIALLRDERLHDDPGALDALSALVPSDPLDFDSRERLLEVGRRNGQHERVAKVLEQTAERADTPSMQGEILMQAAAIYEDALGDAKVAESVYRRVLQLDESDPDLILPSARALEGIYMNLGEHQQLAEVLQLQVRYERDGEARLRLLGRLGELYQSVIQDREKAIEAWKTRLEENPVDEAALAALDELYEAGERWSDLVEVLNRRAEVASEDDQRKWFLGRTAKVQRDKLQSVENAIEGYRALLEQFGPDAESLTALEELYATAERWHDLAETYEQHLDLADSESERLDVFAKLGRLRNYHLNDPEAALEAFRRALSIDTSHEPSRLALESMLESEDAFARREAAGILHPIYDTEGENEKLLRVIEIEVADSDDVVVRLEGLESAMGVAEGALSDSARAYDYAAKAAREAAGHSELQPWLEHLQRLASATGRQRQHVELLREIVDGIFDGDVQQLVTVRIAELARHELEDLGLAQEYYQRALELRPDDTGTLHALETLYEQTNDTAKLLEVLERRAEVATDEQERKALLLRRAKLLNETDGKAQAIEVYESVLDIELEPTAIEALRTLYREAERYVDLIALYQRELEANLGQPAELHVDMAQVAVLQNDLVLAFDELEQALEFERQHGRAIAELERLMKEAAEAEQRARAASLLEPVYLLQGDFDKVMGTLRARLEYADDPVDRRDLLTRLAQLYEEQREDYSAALDTIAQLLPDDLNDENTVYELERLAKVSGEHKRLAEVYASELDKVDLDDSATARLSRRTGELLRDLGESERALKYFRRALAFEPESRELFDAVDQILESAEKHQERVELYREALDHRYEPAERRDALHIIASLQKDKLARTEEAIESYQAALDVDETDEVALDALTSLFGEAERYEDLAELYLRRAESALESGDAARYRLALAQLYKEKLARTEDAIDQLEEIVGAEPENGQAIQELEALRSDTEHKERVVAILRPLYESRDEWLRLIKLNQDRFELASDVADKVSVLRETASLWEERGDDRERARQALAEALMLDPDDLDVRNQYQRLVAQDECWSELTELYQEVLAEKPDLLSKRDLLGVLARTHDEQRDDPRQALAAYQELSQTDDADPEPLDRIEYLSLLLGDWASLVDAKRAKAEVSFSDTERAELWRSVGEIQLQMLNDPEEATRAYERSLELEPHADTVSRLIDLYEDKQDAERLVVLYEQRVELAEASEQELTFELLVRAAAAYEQKLEDNQRAIDMLQRAADVRPADLSAREALNRLYRAEEMWPELLDNLRLEAGAIEDPARRAILRREMGDILAERLQSYDEALDAYRRVLDEASDDEAAVMSVMKIGREQDLFRHQVSEIAVPVLRETRKHALLIEALEMRLGVEADPAERAETLRAMADVYEHELGQSSEALGASVKALAEQPDSVDLHERLERLAEAAEGWPRYADALEERAQATFEPDVSADLWERLGRIAEEKLGELERAVNAYRRAVEIAGDQPELLLALDRLYAKLDQPDDLVEVLERRLSIETSDEAQADIFYRLGVVQVEKFDDAERGVEALKTALDKKADHEAAQDALEKLVEREDLFDQVAAILEEVYRLQNRTDRLSGLYEKRVGFAKSPEERKEMRQNLARVLEDDCSDPAAAQRVLQQGLSEDPTDAILLEQVERLAGATQSWDSAADALKNAVVEREELPPEQARELLVRASQWLSERAGDSLAAERLLEKALEYEPENDDVLVALESLQRAAERKLELVETLRRRARLKFEPTERESLYRQAKELADEQQNPELAESILRELLASDPDNAWALAELTQQREAQGDYEETFELLVRRSRLSEEPSSVRELKRSAADVARNRLNDSNRAIELYAELFEEDASDQEAAVALRELYPQTERYQELATLLERLIDHAKSPEQRTALRLELATLVRDRFEDTDRAVELLRAVLAEDSGSSDAVVKLSELYEAAERDAELAELLSKQIQAAVDRGDVEAELSFRVRLGEVSETRLADPLKAIESYRGVLERDPQHRGALEALGRLYRAQGQHAEAAKVIDQLLGMAESEEAVRLAQELADEYDKLGEREEVASALERGLAVDPKHEALRGRLREVYANTHNWQKLGGLLAQDADEAADEEQKVSLLRQAADTYTKGENFTAAAELLEKAVELRSGDRELLLALCDAYNRSGRGKAAIEVLEKIVESYGGKRSRDLGEIHRRLADAYLSEGDTARALEELDKAFRIEPGNVPVLKRLGEVALEAGDLKKAQRMFQALLLQKLDESSPITKPQVFYQLSFVHEKQGAKPKAIQMLERALQADPSLPGAKERLQELKNS